jgi:predicted lipid-binding transport protein (Tim44 family)
MSEFEIIFFAGIAAFFAYRLWAVLGKTNGDEKSRAAEIITAAEKKPEPVQKPSLIKKAELKPIEIVEEIIPEQFKAEIAEIKKIDTSFTLQNFLTGAEAAFEAVIEAYSSANRKRLKFLLSEDIYNNFDADLSKYEVQKNKAQITLVSVEIPEIIDIELNDSIAQITLKFNSEQINFVTDKKDNIVEGSKSSIERIKDVWVFERDLSSRKPQWLVVGTGE